MKKFLIVMIAFVAALMLLAVILPGDPGEKRALPRDPQYNAVTDTVRRPATTAEVHASRDFVQLLHVQPTVEVLFEEKAP